MKTRAFIFSFLLAGALVLSACGKKAEEPAADTTAVQADTAPAAPSQPAMDTAAAPAAPTTDTAGGHAATATDTAAAGGADTAKK